MQSFDEMNTLGFENLKMQVCGQGGFTRTMGFHLYSVELGINVSGP